MPPVRETRTLRVIFFLQAINYDRIFEGLLRELLRRGHVVRILVQSDRRRLPVGAGEVFESLTAEFGGRLAWELVTETPSAVDVVAYNLRLVLDYLRYLEPEYRLAEPLRLRCRALLPGWLASAIDAAGPGRPAVASVLRALERALPPSPALTERLAAEHADVVMVAPLVALGSPQANALRAARQAGLPTVFPVASWDNLTNKGLVRDVPTATIVWNADQVREAVELQRLPRERVHAVGAHSWDHWFDWRPRTTAEEFAQKTGLDPEHPYFLYACSSQFIGGNEAEFVAEWLDRLRRTDGDLAQAGVLVRPHPQHAEIWKGVELGAGAVVWPRAGEAPTSEQRKSDYYDSLYHALGVIGINTSVLMESAIVRRPVFTVATERYRSVQRGTLHFEYLARDGGALTVAESWDEHFQQLAELYANPARHAKQLEGFLRRFVRPYGLDEPAAPRAAAVVEAAAEEVVLTSARPVAFARLVVSLWTGGVSLRHALGRVRRRLRRVT